MMIPHSNVKSTPPLTGISPGIYSVALLLTHTRKITDVTFSRHSNCGHYTPSEIYPASLGFLFTRVIRLAER